MPDYREFNAMRFFSPYCFPLAECDQHESAWDTSRGATEYVEAFEVPLVNFTLDKIARDVPILFLKKSAFALV